MYLRYIILSSRCSRRPSPSPSPFPSPFYFYVHVLVYVHLLILLFVFCFALALSLPLKGLYDTLAVVDLLKGALLQTQGAPWPKGTSAYR